MDHLGSYSMNKSGPEESLPQDYVIATPIDPLRALNRAPPDKVFLYTPDDDRQISLLGTSAGSRTSWTTRPRCR